MRACVRVYKKASEGGIFSHCNPCRSFTVRKGRTQRKVNCASEGGCAIRESPPGRTAVGAPHPRPAGRPGSAGGAQRPAGDPRRVAEEGAGEQLLPQTSGNLCAYDSMGRGRRHGSPAFALAAISWQQPLHPFLWGTESSRLRLGVVARFVSLFKFPRSHTLLCGGAGG